MPKNSPKLTNTEFASLLVRGGIIYYERARLCVMRLRDPATGVSERRFVMEGPSGKHTLLVDATDLARLNGHWINFAQDARNAFPAAAARSAQRSEVAQMRAQR